MLTLNCHLDEMGGEIDPTSSARVTTLIMDDINALRVAHMPPTTDIEDLYRHDFDMAARVNLSGLVDYLPEVQHVAFMVICVLQP